LIDNLLSLIIAVGLMTFLATLSETGKSGIAKKFGFLLVTLLINMVVFLFLFPGNYFDGVLFALAGVGVALLSKGHLGRALAFTFFLSPILMATLLSSSALTLNGLLPGSVLVFAGLSVAVSTAIVITGSIPALIFRLTNISMSRNFRLRSPASGLYWSSAFWLYALANSRSILSYPTLPLTFLAWILFVIVTQEAGGLASKIVAQRLNLLPPPAYDVTVTVLNSSTRHPVSGAQVDLEGRVMVSGVAGSAAYASIPGGKHSLVVRAANYQQANLTVNIGPNPKVDVLLEPTPIPTGPNLSVYTVVVTVSDSNSHDAIAGAQVALGGKTHLTGGDGVAMFANVSAGTHDITSTAPDYTTKRIRISVSSNSTITVVMNLISGRFEWPTDMQYMVAFKDLGKFVLDPELGKGSAPPGMNTFTEYYPGQMAMVFKVDCGKKSFAVKCFTRLSPELRVIDHRYKIIDEVYNFAQWPYLVDFHYLPAGILIAGRKYPIVRMAWVSGSTLSQFAQQNLQNPRVLTDTAESFIDGVIALRKSRVAHGDLAGDNVIIEKEPAGSVKTTFVDLDGLYTDNFRGEPSPEKGKPPFQHPLRTEFGGEKYYDERLDGFSALVIYMSLLSLAENPQLWRYNRDEDKLLITVGDDFKNPNSPLLAELAKSNSRKVRKLNDLLRESLSHDPLWDGLDPRLLKSL
jgi:hypothetical protein